MEAIYLILLLSIILFPIIIKHKYLNKKSERNCPKHHTASAEYFHAMKSVEHLTKVNYDNIYPLKKGNIIAYCRSNYNPATNAKVSMIENGKKYNVDYAIIGSSWSGVCFSELPEQLFNSILFSFYIDGEEINIIKDYLAITRISNDTSRATTLIIYSDLSENRIVEIKKQYANLRILVRSNIINKWLLDKELL